MPGPMLTRAATVSGDSDIGTIACTSTAAVVCAGGIMCSGPTTGVDPPSVSFRIENEPSMPTQSVELSSDSARTSGSDPIGMAAVTVADLGSTAVIVFG